MEGHLVTVASKDENDFLVQAFSGEEFQRYFGGTFFEAWAGATDSEREGEWKWACGPEQGATFWDDEETRAIAYSNWQAGGPLPDVDLEARDYLLWRASLYPSDNSDELGVWVSRHQRRAGRIRQRWSHCRVLSRQRISS